MAARILLLVQPTETVAVCATNSPDWLVLEYAAALAGVALVPVNPAFTDAEISHILAVSNVTAVLADETFRGSPLLRRLETLAVACGMRATHSLADWRTLPASAEPLPRVNCDAPFLIQFTSGTTGRPKGAVLSHRAAFNCARLSMRRLGGTSEDIWLTAMPFHHVGGSVSCALTVLSVGATIVVVPGFEPGAVLDLMARTGATVGGGVPTMLLALMEHPAFPATELGSLRALQTGGASVAPSLIREVERQFGATVVNAYGQSESPNAIQTSLDDDDTTKARTIGRPLPLREVRIVGAGGSVLPLDQVGEMWMRSPLVMDGYIGVSPEVSAQTLDTDGWLHTGDLCSMDERGVVRLHGRLRDVIIRGGENIYAAEVEDALLQHPAIADVAVVAQPDERWGEVPVAFFRVVPGHTARPVEVEAFARERLASFKVPRRWEQLDEFPLTASGKVKKFELQARLQGDADPAPA